MSQDASAPAPDAVPADAPAGCNTAGLDCKLSVAVAAVDCNGACWVSCQSSTQIDQVTAKQACASWGGTLAPLRGPDDEACVAETVFPVQASWIGLEQANTGMLWTGWTWNSDDTPPGFTRWDVGQPNDADGAESGEEQCAMMNTMGNWHDVPCLNTLYRFSCRR